MDRHETDQAEKLNAEEDSALLRTSSETHNSSGQDSGEESPLFQFELQRFPSPPLRIRFRTSAQETELQPTVSSNCELCLPSSPIERLNSCSSPTGGVLRDERTLTGTQEDSRLPRRRSNCERLTLSSLQHEAHPWRFETTHSNAVSRPMQNFELNAPAAMPSCREEPPGSSPRCSSVPRRYHAPSSTHERFCVRADWHEGVSGISIQPFGVNSDDTSHQKVRTRKRNLYSPAPESKKKPMRELQTSSKKTVGFVQRHGRDEVAAYLLEKKLQEAIQRDQ